MRLATIKIENNETGKAEEVAGILTQKGVLPIRALNEARAEAFGGKDPETGMPSLAFIGGTIPVMWEEQMLPLIESGQLRDLTEWYNDGGKDTLETIPGIIPFEEVKYAPLYRNPKRIFGIGLNYKDHAGDIGDKAPEGFPGSFFKMADTLIGPGDEIKLPKLKEATGTTAEAELGVIMAKECRDVSEENWRDVIAGFTTVIDMTEESILKGNEYLEGNPRYLTIVKNFPTFFSFGPQLVTPDEVPDVLELEVQSVLNGEVYAKNVVANMTHRPARLVSLHSSIQGWYPGDVLSTGTPRAFHIKDGDIAECRITGPDGFAMEPLVNPVADLKPAAERDSAEADKNVRPAGDTEVSDNAGSAGVAEVPGNAQSAGHTEVPEGECLICGAPIEYLESEEPMECEICHKKENSRTRCVNGHYVCDECHTTG
ncbi:MAG: fumarylacetoacetate hydrolase family protein, partial [Firmicutes bacterium]|nr:fumarylacetoacetate hydrolase family protein [Bacillota bacterium]